MKRLALEWEHKHHQLCEGLAAVQIGVPLRIVIVRGNSVMRPPKPTRYRKHTNPDGSESRKETHPYREWVRVFEHFDPWIVLINPRIRNEVGEQDSTEGCLSIPDSFYRVKRPQTVVFKYTTDKGKHTPLMVAEGFHAAAMRHEIDHLNGVLISDAGVLVDLEPGTEGKTL
jgi:peptide deformylase